MMFWFLLFGLFLVALAIMVIPLFRYRNETGPKNERESIEVYKAQLQELVADQNNGVLNAAEATSARLEIERRLLKIADNKSDKKGTDSVNASPTLVMVVTTIVLLLSAGFYLLIGRPGMPDFALEDQEYSVTRQAGKKAGAQDMIKEVADIQAHLQLNPDDGKAWRALGQYQSELQNRIEAAQAFQHWYELAPDNIDAAVIYGESLIIMSNGRVGPAALLVLNKARKIQPGNPGVRHYLALAQYQSGDIAQALANWRKLAADSEPDAPWLSQLRAWIRRAESDLGIESTTSIGPPALSDAQRSAVGKMSSAEQSAMIKSMVGRLQDRMDQNPENVEGWRQLAKAYGVLGQREDVIKSLQQALKYAPDDAKPQIKKQLEIILKQE